MRSLWEPLISFLSPCCHGPIPQDSLLSRLLTASGLITTNGQRDRLVKHRVHPLSLTYRLKLSPPPSHPPQSLWKPNPFTQNHLTLSKLANVTPCVDWNWPQLFICRIILMIMINLTILDRSGSSLIVSVPGRVRRSFKIWMDRGCNW
jgi:hypothetical protein